MLNRFVKAVLFCGIAVFVLQLGYWLFWGSHLSKVNLTNLGEDRLTDVVLHVSGQSYSLGNVDAKASVVADVFPKYDSHLVVEFTSFGGVRKRFDASGYFGPDTPAAIEIFMDSNAIQSSTVRYR